MGISRSFGWWAFPAFALAWAGCSGGSAGKGLAGDAAPMDAVGGDTAVAGDVAVDGGEAPSTQDGSDDGDAMDVAEHDASPDGLVAPTGPLEPAPAKVHVDQAHGVDLTFDAAGGTASTTAADGTVYKLVAPKGAVRASTTIRLDPFTSIDGLPFAGGLAAGFHLSPAGLAFAKPIEVDVTLGAGVKTDDLTGFCYEGDDVDLHLCPILVSGQTLTFHLAHFSGGGAGQGAGTPTPTLAESQAQQAVATYLANARRMNKPVVAADVEAILLGWYTSSVKPNLTGAALEVDPMPRFREWRAWEELVRPGPPWDADAGMTIALDLQPELEEATRLAATALKALVDDANKACRADHKLSHARDAMRWQAQAALFNLDQRGYKLDLPYVLANLCVQVIYDAEDFPMTLAMGQSGTLTLKVGYWVDESVKLFDQPMRVKVAATGATPAGTRTRTTGPDGTLSASYVREADGTPLELDIDACFADPGLQLVCAPATIVRGATSPSLDKYKANAFLDRSKAPGVPSDVKAGEEWAFVSVDGKGKVELRLNLSSVPGNGFTYLGAQLGITSASGSSFSAKGTDPGGVFTYTIDAHFEVRADGVHLIASGNKMQPGETIDITFDGLCENCAP